MDERALTLFVAFNVELKVSATRVMYCQTPRILVMV